MNVSPANHYAVLGVERDADDRAIKKAYFTLIRQHPPETAPEEFQRIRQAYEVLSDPEKRREYDASARFTAYGDQSDGRLTEAQYAIDSEDWTRALALLQPLVEERPDLHAAVDLLAQAHLNLNQGPAALQLLHRLVSERGDVAAYQLHYALALHAIGRARDALEPARKSVELDPKEMSGYRLVIALAEETENKELAVQYITFAIEQFGSNLIDLFDLTLRRVRHEVPALGTRHLLKSVDELLEKVPESTDTDTRKYLAGRLAGIAAWYFSESDFDTANGLMERCRRLRRNTGVEGPFPARIDANVDELSPERQAFLLQAGQNSDLAPVVQSMRGQTYIFGLICVALIVFSLGVAFGARGLWPSFERGALLFMLAGAFLAAAFLARRIWRYFTSEHDSLRIVHSIYFILVQFNRIQAWPLFTLKNVQLTNHHTNGAYTHTAVDVYFQEAKHSFAFKREDLAVTWAEALGQKRVTALQMLAAGLLEEDPDAQFFPPEIVERSQRGEYVPGTGRAETLKWYGAAATAALLCWVVAINVNSRRAAEANFQQALQTTGITGLSKYLATEPPHGLASETKALLEKRLDEARKHCAARLLPLPGSSTALCRFLDEPGATQSAPVRIVATLDTEWDQTPAAPEEGEATPVPATVWAEPAKQWNDQWLRLVSTAADQLMGEGMLATELASNEGTGPEVRAKCEVRRQGVLAGSKLWSLALSCRVSLEAANAATLASFSHTVSARELLGSADVAPENASEAYGEMLRLLSRHMLATSLERLGVAAEGQASLLAFDTAATLKVSPYGPSASSTP